MRGPTDWPQLDQWLCFMNWVSGEDLNKGIPPHKRDGRVLQATGLVHSLVSGPRYASQAGSTPSPGCPRCGPCAKPKPTYLLGCQDTLVALGVSSDGKMVPVVTSHDAVGGPPCRWVRGIQISHCQPLHLMAHCVLGHTGLVLSAWKTQHCQSGEANSSKRRFSSFHRLSPPPNSRGAPCRSPFLGHAQMQNAPGVNFTAC